MVRSKVPNTNQKTAPALQNQTQLSDTGQHPSPQKLQKQASERHHQTEESVHDLTPTTDKGSAQATSQSPQDAHSIERPAQKLSDPHQLQDTTHTDPKQIADALNDNYITIGHRTSLTIPHQQEDSISMPTTSNSSPPFELQTIELDEVERLLRTLNRYKASDIFRIKPAVLKTDSWPHLTRLFNKTIAENQYPDSIKSPWSSRSTSLVTSPFQRTTAPSPSFQSSPKSSHHHQEASADIQPPLTHSVRLQTQLFLHHDARDSAE